MGRGACSRVREAELIKQTGKNRRRVKQDEQRLATGSGPHWLPGQSSASLLFSICLMGTNALLTTMQSAKQRGGITWWLDPHKNTKQRHELFLCPRGPRS